MEICPRPTLSESKYSTEEATGIRMPGLSHYFNFRSAYGGYEFFSEPMYTFASEKYTGTIDYIFFSAPVSQRSVPLIL